MTLSIDAMDNYRIIQRSTTSGDAPGSTTLYGRGWGEVDLSITSDTTSPLSYRIRDAQDPTRVIEDWSSTGQSSTTGTSQLHLNIDASEDCYIVDIAQTSNLNSYTSSTPFFVGNVDAAAGQSKASAFFGAYAYPSDYWEAQPSLYGVSAPFSTRVLSDNNGNPFYSTPMTWQQPGDDTIAGGGAVSTFPATYLTLREQELGVACGLVGLAKPGSSISEWQPGTNYWYELQALLQREGNHVSDFIWNQGDSDWNTAGVSAYQSEFQTLANSLDGLLGTSYHLLAYDYMWIGGMQPDRFVTQVDQAKAIVAGSHGGSFMEAASAGSNYFGGHPTMLARILAAQDLFRQVLSIDNPSADQGPALTGLGSVSGNTINLQVQQDKGTRLVGQITNYGSTSFSIDVASTADLVSQFSAFEHGYTDAAHELTITAVDLVSGNDIRLTLATSTTGAIDVWYRADYGTPGNPNAAIRDDVTDYGISYGHQLQTRLTPIVIDEGASVSSSSSNTNSGGLSQTTSNAPSTSPTTPSLIPTSVSPPSSVPLPVASTAPSDLPAAAPTILSDPDSSHVRAPQVTLPSSPEQFGIYRFFDTATGAHIFTSDPTEFISSSTFVEEKNDFGSLPENSLDTDSASAEVYRLFDTSTGGHFYTTNKAELDGLTNPSSSTYRPDLVFEPASSFVEHTSEQAGDVAVYRFFDMTTGGHFFTSSQSEYTAIIDPAAAAYRADLHPEGIAFYAPSAQ